MGVNTVRERNREWLKTEETLGARKEVWKKKKKKSNTQTKR